MESGVSRRTGGKAPLVTVVDDELNLCNALQRVLEAEGYRVSTATNGEDALSLISREKPDVILLDIMMPGLNGVEVSSRVHQICDSRIIFFSARADLLKRGKNGELSGDAFIAKPATAKRILAAVDATIEGR